MSVYVVDAKGLSCPEPVLLVQQAVKGNNHLEVQVNSATARDNVAALLEREGYTVAVGDLEDGWTLTASK